MASRAIGSLFVAMSASATKFAKDMATARASAKKTGKGFKSSFHQANMATIALAKSLKTMGLAIVTIAGPAALGMLIKKSIETADRIAKVADSAGIGTDALQELQHAAQISGVSQDSLNSALQAFTKRVGEAKSGTGTLITLLGKMDKELLANVQAATTTEEAFDLIVTKGAEMTNQLDRAALFAAAFGRTAGVEMTNLIKNGVTGLEDLRKEAHDLGLVMDESMLRSAEDANDALTRLGGVLSKNVMKAVLGVAPQIENLSEKLIEFAPLIVDAAEKVATFLSGFGGGSETEKQIQGLYNQINKNAMAMFELSKEMERLQAIDTSGNWSGQQGLALAFRKSKEEIDAQIESIKKQQKALEADTQIANYMINQLREASTATDELSGSTDNLATSTDQWSASLINVSLAAQDTQARMTSLAEIQKQLSIDTTDFIISNMETLEGAEAESLERRFAKEKELNDRKMALAQQYLGVVADISDNIISIQTGRVDTELQKETEGAQRSYEIRKAAIIRQNTVAGQLTAAGLQKLDALEVAHQATVLNLEKDAEEEKKRIAKSGRLIKIAQAISNTALGVTAALAQANPILAALIATAGATQVAAIRAQPYAKGGLVDSPTYFSMASGNTGLMGEAGEEWIMPAKRMSNGELGVQVEFPEANMKPSLTVINHFNGPVTDEKYAVDVIGKALVNASKRGYSRLAVK